MLQIAEVALRDFQGHTRMDLRLQALTFLRGANGSGKSSIRRAVEWVLTGQVSDLDVTARSAAAVLVRGFGTPEGARKGAVMIRLSDGSRVIRDVPKGLKAKHPVTGKELDEHQFRRTYHLPPTELMAAACNPSQIIEMKPDDLRNLLLALLTDGMGREEVLRAIREWLSFQPKATDDAVHALMDYAATNLPEWPAVSDLDRLHREAYGARREANGAVRALKQQLSGLRETAQNAPSVSEAELDQIRRRLSGYQEAAQQLRAGLAVSQELAKRRAAAEQDLLAVRQQLAELRKRTGVAAGDGHPGDESQLRGQIDVLQQQLRTVREQAGACPVYLGVTCPLPAETVETHTGKLRQQRHGLIQELGQVVIHHACDRVQAAEAALAALPEHPGAAGEQELARLQRLIESETERLQRLAATSGVRSGAKETAARVGQQLAEAEAEAAKLNLAVKCFDVDGMRKQLVGRRLVALQDRANEGLARFLGEGWSVRLNGEGDHPIRISHPRHDAAVLKSLSRAEQTLVAVALLDALNDFHQLGLLCIDDVEHLTGSGREALFQALHDWAGSERYGTILVAEADGSPPASGVTVCHAVDRGEPGGRANE